MDILKQKSGSWHRGEIMNVMKEVSLIPIDEYHVDSILDLLIILR